MQRLTFRPMFNRVLSIAAWAILAALVVGTLLAPGSFAAAPGIVLGAAAVAALVWAVLWAPYVAVDDEGVEVANVLREYRVPWPALIHVETRYALVLHTPGRKISATAAPAPGAFSAVRATRAARRSDTATAGARPGDLPGTDSGDAASMVLDRWHGLRDAGRVEAGVAEQTPVTVRPRTAQVAAIVVGVAALIGAILLV
jgi:hypothetical protein